MSETADALNGMRDLVGRWKQAVMKKPRTMNRALMGYGFALADGTSRYGEPCFIVVTQNGEGLILTHELLRALATNPLVLCGEVICSIETDDQVEAEYQAVRELSVLLVVGHRRLQPRDYATITTRITPADLEFTTWTFLTRERPQGWPD